MLMKRLFITFLLLVLGKKVDAYNYNYYSYGNQNSLDIVSCSDSVVQVTYVQVSCDSPYTFYYGNGANRNSPVCDYGDKATFTVDFRIADDIDQVNDVYMTIAAYDSQENLLASTQPEFLCDTYLGYDCTVAGTYSFTVQLKLGVFEYNVTAFQPELRMAFSTAADHGYNLGAVNTDCPEWEDPSQAYVDWNNQHRPSFFYEFALEYGLLVTAAMGLVGMFVYVRRQAGEYHEREAFILDPGAAGGNGINLMD